MGRLGSPFRRSSEDQRHHDPRSHGPNESNVECALFAGVPSIPLLELWRQCCHSRAGLDHQWRMLLQAR